MINNLKNFSLSVDLLYEIKKNYMIFFEIIPKKINFKKMFKCILLSYIVYVCFCLMSYMVLVPLLITYLSEKVYLDNARVSALTYIAFLFLPIYISIMNLPCFAFIWHFLPTDPAAEIARNLYSRIYPQEY